jgi:hypothetical protein
MVAMAVSVITIAAASTVFIDIFRNFKQQSRIAITNIEGLIGFELLRRDLENAGYGLPWVVTGANYLEVAGLPGQNYNDAPADPPKAVVSGNDIGTNNSDYLIIKSVNVAKNSASDLWTTLRSGNVKRTWVPSMENLANGDRVVVLDVGRTAADQHALVLDGGNFSTTYGATANFAPADSSTAHIIYGIDPDTSLRAPFNRADYFIDTTDVPARCAPNTGRLIKAAMSHANGTLTGNQMVLWDCVADLQVVYRLDTNADGIVDSSDNDMTALDAAAIRAQLKEVRVYILAHEGQKDSRHTYPTGTVTVGEFGMGSNFDLTALTATWQNYRWKVYTIGISM